MDWAIKSCRDNFPKKKRVQLMSAFSAFVIRPRGVPPTRPTNPTFVNPLPPNPTARGSQTQTQVLTFKNPTSVGWLRVSSSKTCDTKPNKNTLIPTIFQDFFWQLFLAKYYKFLATNATKSGGYTLDLVSSLHDLVKISPNSTRSLLDLDRSH